MEHCNENNNNICLSQKQNNEFELSFHSGAPVFGLRLRKICLTLSNEWVSLGVEETKHTNHNNQREDTSELGAIALEMNMGKKRNSSEIQYLNSESNQTSV